LTRRSLKLIAPEEGPVFLVDELQHGRKGEIGVSIAGGAEQGARVRGAQGVESRV
jgi:hypothetical protein